MKKIDVEETKKSAMGAYGHIDGMTEEKALCLRISNLQSSRDHERGVNQMHYSRGRVLERALEECGVDIRSLNWDKDRQNEI